MEPTDMSAKHSDANTVLSGRVHRVNNPAANERMPKSVWQPGVVQRLADYIKHLREVDQQPNKSDITSQPAESNERHVCKFNAGYTCACPAGVCASDDATYRYARGPYVATSPTTEPTIRGSTTAQCDRSRCPISGQSCTKANCRDWCESGVDYSKT